MLEPKLKKQLEATCFSIYPKRVKATLLKSENEFFSFLRKNRLDHSYAIAFNTSSRLKEEYQQYKKKIVKSLQILGKHIEPKDFIVIKTFSNYPHLTSDLDIVVRTKTLATLYQSLKLPFAWDINHQISWTNDEEISHEFIWKNTRPYDYNGIKVQIPNPDLDMLIRLAHLPFEQAEIRLGELLHIFVETKKTDWLKVENEAKKNRWQKTFRRTKKFLDNLHVKLYQSDEFVDFPAKLPYWDLASAVIEKKSWKKILGARYVLRDRFFNK